MTEFSPGMAIERSKRGSICTICHKQIGVKSLRVTFIVTSHYSGIDYKNFMHYDCMLGLVDKSLKNYIEGVKEAKLQELSKKVAALRKKYERIKKFEDMI